MLFRVELLGGFALYAEGKPEPLAVRSYSRIYALLALHLGQGVLRRQIINALWPDVSQQVAANRLRVALSEFRKELGPALLEWDGMVGLNPELVSVDLHDLTSQLEFNDDEIDEEFEISSFEQELTRLSKQLLPLLDEPWVEEFQRKWSHDALSALKRLSDLAWKNDNHKLVFASAEAALKHDPFDDYHWQAYLRSRSILGDTAEALRTFGQAQRSIKTTIEGEFSEETLELVAELKLGRLNQVGKPSHILNQRESEYLTKLFHKVAQTQPEVAMAFLGTPGTGLEHVNFSDVSVPILEDLVINSTSRSENWQRALFNLLIVKSGLNDSGAMLKYGQILLDSNPDVRIVSFTMTYMAFAHLQLRSYDEGIQLADEGIKLMEDLGRTKDACQLYTNKASLLWHQGIFEPALEFYDISSEAAKMLSKEAEERTVGTNEVNKGLVHLMKGTPEEGLSHLEVALEMLTEAGLESNYPLLLPPVGYARYIVNSDPSGIDLVVKGLKIGYRIGHERGMQITLDFAAGILARAGKKQFAVEVLAFAKGWRESTAHPFSVAEQMFVDRVLVECGCEDLGGRDLSSVGYRSVLNRVVQELRSIERSMTAL